MEYKSPLHKTVMMTQTQYWNDSCAQEELKYAIEHGAVGATTNPVIVTEVLAKELDLWKDRIVEIIKEMPTATEDDVAWKLNEEMAVRGAKLLQPIYEKENGLKGRISIQTNAKYYRDAEAMWKQAVRFDKLAPNMHVKMPVTEAGVKAIEESTYNGVSVNATVSFTVPQALAVGEAIERGLARRKSEGKDCSKMAPVCTIMVGRLDDYIKACADKDNIAIDPCVFEWAGVAVFKNAYKIYRERGYRTKLLAAATRHHLHWSEFIGGDVVLTIPYKWAFRFNKSDVEVKERMDVPVDKKIVDTLLAKFPEFRKAYEPDGMKPSEFADYGATRKTLTQFLGGYADLVKIIRGFMIKE